MSRFGAGFQDISGRRYGLLREAVSEAGIIQRGGQGGIYRSFFFINSDSQPAGHAVAFSTVAASETAVTAASAGPNSTVAVDVFHAYPYIGATTSSLEVNDFAGILAEDKLGPGVYWVQVGGMVSLAVASSAAQATRVAGRAWVAVTQSTQTASLSNGRGSATATVTAPTWTTQASVPGIEADLAQFAGGFSPASPGVFNAIDVTALATSGAAPSEGFWIAPPETHSHRGLQTT